MSSSFIKIPESEKDSLKRLLSFSADERAKLLAVFRSTKPTLGLGEWASKVGGQFGAERSSVERVVWTLGTLYMTRVHHPTEPLEKLVADLRRAAEAELDKELGKREAWDALTPDLIALLSEDETLGVTVKAIDVMTEVERNFREARVVTDFRPVFGKDVAPAAGVVIHNLRLSFIQDGDEHEIVFGLDADDLKSLRDVIDRAIRKGASLTKLMRRADLPVLEASK